MSIRQAWLSLSRFQRRSAWEYRAAALTAQSQGKQQRYERLRKLSDQSWREAKFNLWLARTWPVEKQAEQAMKEAA